MVEDYIHQTYLVGRYSKCTNSDFFSISWARDMERHYPKGPGEVVISKSSGTFHLIKNAHSKAQNSENLSLHARLCNDPLSCNDCSKHLTHHITSPSIGKVASIR